MMTKLQCKFDENPLKNVGVAHRRNCLRPPICPLTNIPKSYNNQTCPLESLVEKYDDNNNEIAKSICPGYYFNQKEIFHQSH